MPQHFLFWLAAASFFLFDDRVDTPSRAPLSFAFGLTCLAVLFAARTVSSGSGKARKAVHHAYVAGAIALLGLLSLHGTYLRTVGGLHAQAIEAILQTDLAEAFGYVATRLFPLWAAFWAASVALLLVTLPRSPDRVTSRRAAQAILLVGGLAFLALGRGIVTEPIKIIQSYQDGVQELREATLRWKSQPPAPVSSDFDGTIILVIGESTSRHHMSIYGYPRETTPRLSALRPELAVFEDVIANLTSTVDSLTAALILPAPRQQNRPSILQMAKAAGFETTWLSNQNEFGVWDNPVRILAQQADHVRFHDPSVGEIASRKVFDEAMLPSLEEALDRRGAPRRLIVVHLMSTHLPYCWTKPPGFNPLKGDYGKRLYGREGSLLSRLKLFIRRRSRNLDCYDNGVRYVDAQLGAIIARARRLKEPAAVLYFSDHGEAPLLATGHDGAEHSAYHLEIPFILWGNEAYRSAYAGSWRDALANQAKPFSLSLMAPTLVDLLQLKTPLLKREDSLLDPAFRPRQRFALDGRIRYDSRWKGNDYRENSRVFVRELGPFRDRVWPHRINTLGALLEAKRTFAGVEMDAHFDQRTNTFQVRHEYPDIGLTLRDMLEWSRDKPQLRVWLDWKNATPANVRAALSELGTLDRQFGLKERLLVETDSDATSPVLALISKAGFRHGYYLPIDRIQEAMRKGGPAPDRVANEVKQVLLRGRFDAITYDASLHPFVQAKLDSFLREHGLRRYSWDTSIDSGNAQSNPAAVAAIVRDRSLDALLVRFPSDFRI